MLEQAQTGTGTTWKFCKYLTHVRYGTFVSSCGTHGKSILLSCLGYYSMVTGKEKGPALLTTSVPTST